MISLLYSAHCKQYKLDKNILKFIDIERYLD